MLLIKSYLLALSKKSQWPLFYLTGMGLISGIIVALVVLGFRWVIDVTLPLISDAPNGEDFESLDYKTRMVIVLAGGFFIALILNWLKPEHRQTGIAYVINQMRNHQGALPLRNTIVQFVTASIALISGQSVGREGPAVHIGAGAVLAVQQNKRPWNNKILIGCGTAAAISASFNTPIAGVIFAMEVILMEYTLIGFLPIITAAMSAAVLSQWYPHQELQIDHLIGQFDYTQTPWLIILGVAIGTLAAAFNKSIRWFLQFGHLSIFSRIIVASGITALIGILMPEVLGSGYDSLQSAINGEFVFKTLLALIVLKLIATAIAVGLGMPAGLIGPTFVIGAASGGLFAYIANHWLNWPADNVTYVLIGMTTMMAAVLHAPLAAMMAVLELSSDTNILLPSMIAVVSAILTNQIIFRQPPIFNAILSAQGLHIDHLNIYQQQRWLSDIASNNYSLIRKPPNLEKTIKLIKNKSSQILIAREQEVRLYDYEMLEVWRDWLKDHPNECSEQAFIEQVPNDQLICKLETDIHFYQALQQLYKLEFHGFLLPIDKNRYGLVTQSQLLEHLERQNK